MSVPSTRIVPRSGGTAPAIMLIVVVLPDPLGPMSPTKSPRLRTSETPSTATTPPKRLLSSSAWKKVASAALMARLGSARGLGLHVPRRERPLDRRQKAVLREALDQDEGEAKEDETPLALPAQHLRQDVDEDGADDRARQTLDAADDCHGDHQAHLRDDHDRRREDADEVAVIGAGKRRDAAGDHENHDLAERRVDAAGARRLLIFAKRAQEKSDAGRQQALHGQERGKEKRQSGIVIGDIAAMTVKNGHRQAKAAAGQRLLGDENEAEDFRNRQGE